MRLSKPLKIDDGLSLTISELRVKEVRNLAKILKDNEVFLDDNGITNKKLVDVLVDHYDSIEEILTGCVTASREDFKIAELSFSDAISVFQTFVEVNPVFLSLVQGEETSSGS